MQLFDCSDKIALVTGGGRGLGRIMAESLAEAGAQVILCSRKVEALKETADKIQKSGHKSLSMALDVTNPEDVEQAVQKIMEMSGRIDILINNAGTSWGAPALDMPLDAWHKVIETNLTGTFLMSQRVGREMVGRKSGKIINIASVAGLGGSRPDVLDAVGYSASKAGIIALTKDLAVKWGPYGVTVNAIAPGFFPTKMTRVLLERHGEAILQQIPLGRFGTEDDIKGLIVFLSSRASEYMTGSIIVVDGGQQA